MINWELISQGLADQIERLHDQGVISMGTRDKMMLDYDIARGQWKNLAGIMYYAVKAGDVQKAIDIYEQAMKNHGPSWDRETDVLNQGLEDLVFEYKALAETMYRQLRVMDCSCIGKCKCGYADTLEIYENWENDDR